MKRIGLLMVAAMLGLSGPVRAEAPSVLLEKAIYAEQTEGNLDDAIRLYEQVIAEAETNRQHAAEAYYRLGSCYLQKGEKEKAARTLRELLAKYSDQPGPAAKARRMLAKLPPVGDRPLVLGTSPEAFANNVSPDLDKITVTFDRPMQDGGWSWTGDGETFPKATGGPRYDSRRMTCVLPVKLEPGRVYWVGINSPSLRNFRSESGQPVLPYVILFATATADGQPTTIPDDLTAEAETINSQAGPLATSQPATLELQPAPWPKSEVMRLRLVTPAGMEVGEQIWTVQADKADDVEAWRIESRMTIPVNNAWQFTQVLTRQDTFAPITGVTRHQGGEFDARYGKNAVELTTTMKDNLTSRTMDIDRKVFDNEQAIYVIRRMPLAEGYNGSFWIFPVQSSVVVECRINVTGKETIKTPAGEFECFALELRVFAGNTCALTHRLWISTDQHRYLVKYDADTVVMELVEAGPWVKQPTTYTNREVGAAVTVPTGWFVYENQTPLPYKFMLYLLSPEMKVWSVLATTELSLAEATPKEVADGDIQVLKGYFKGYTVREGSWADVTVAGRPAIRFVADYQDDGRTMVEERTYILGESMVYWFVFRVEKALFDQHKPVFEKIVSSLDLKPAAAATPDGQ